MKRKLNKLIPVLLVLALTIGILTFTTSAAGLTAKPTSSAVMVNGIQVVFDAYNINDNNYFKLRDLAFVLNGTVKQFKVDWDGAGNAISLTSGQPYTVIGGEMEIKGAGNKTPVPTSSKIYLDGRAVNFTAYNIDGNNYFKLRDVGEAFNFGTDWDAVNRTIVIDTNKAYTPEAGATPGVTLVDAPAIPPLVVPTNAPVAEKTFYEFIQGALDACELGLAFQYIGYDRAARSIYGASAASISSVRYAVDCLLGSAPEAGRLNDWNSIASLSWSSPAPYFFEGLVHEAKGRSAEASECYRKEALNPGAFAGSDRDELKTLKGMDQIALRNLRAELVKAEDSIFTEFNPAASVIPRHEKNFDPEYLKGRAQKSLDDDGDAVSALAYFAASLQVNPFNGDNYAGPVIVYFVLEEFDIAFDYLNEGLLVAPENAWLNALLSLFKEAMR